MIFRLANEAEVNEAGAKDEAKLRRVAGDTGAVTRECDDKFAG